MFDTDHTSDREKQAPLTEAQQPADVETLSTPTDDVIDLVTIRQQEAMKTAETAGAALIAALAEAQQELTDFVSERIRQDIDTQRDLIRCRTLTDLQQVQSRFLRTALENYSTEATRLLRLGSKTMTKSLRR